MDAASRETTIIEILNALRRITQAAERHSCDLVKQVGLTGPQLVILGEVARRGEAALGDIARRVSLSQATLTGVVERLESRGLVTRRRSPQDRRKVLVQATPEALALLRTAPPPLQESFLQQFERLADWERTSMIGALQRIAAMMSGETAQGEDRPSPPPPLRSTG
jgi:DNA-binding MarR family transcriptional regulator